MLHHRQQFHMGVSHFLYIFYNLRSNFPVIDIILSFPRCHKASQIHFIDAHRSITALIFFAAFQKFVVLPLIITDIRNYRSRLRSLLCCIAVGVSLQISKSALDLQLVFVTVSGFRSGNKQFKDTGIPQPSHLMDPPVPFIKITDYADTHGIRRPDGKIGSLVPIQFHGMCSQLFIDCIMNAGGKTIHVFLRDLRNMPVRIPTDPSVCLTVFGLTIFHYIFIRCHFLCIYQCGKISLFICQFHGNIHKKCLSHLSGLLPVDRYFLCSREVCLYQHFASLLMGSQQLMGIIAFGIRDLFYFGPVHQFIKFICHIPSFLRHDCYILFCHFCL